MIDVLPRTILAELPTPVSKTTLHANNRTADVWVKHDDRSARDYGGNKVRKLEFIFPRAIARNAKRVATFGAAGSHHALATALYANQLGLDCTCFLSHQQKSNKAMRTLAAHVNLGTELVYFGGGRASRLETLRRYAQGRDCWVVPVGGSSWLGCVGFVRAALELAGQVEAGELPCPDELYVATGTMGTAAGLALGLAIADLPTRVQAVRVTDEQFANPAGLRRLISKTALMLRMHGAVIPARALARIKLAFRDEFFAGGYAKSNEATEFAVRTAAAGELQLETTYTGKAMAALLHDIDRQRDAETVLFWNTYNSRPWPAACSGDVDISDVPEAFRRYFD